MISFELFHFQIIFFLIFFLVIIIIVIIGITGIAQWNKNNQSPRIIVPAMVVAKRTHVIHQHHDINTVSGSHITSSTEYYITFQLETGDRMELKLTGFEYGQLAEGDSGRLTFQGTRYLGFERT